MKYLRNVWVTLVLTILIAIIILPLAKAEDNILVCNPTSATFFPVHREVTKEGYYYLTVTIEFRNNTVNSYNLQSAISRFI